MKKFQIKDKRKFVIFCSITIAFLISLFVVIYISNLWFSQKSKESEIYDNNGQKVKSNKISQINTYVPEKNIEENIKDGYFAEIEKLLLRDNVDKLYLKTDKEFLEKNGLNNSNFKEFLEKNEYIGNFPSVSSMRYCIQADGSCVYRLKCFSDSRREFYVNLIEKKLYEYTIDFSQDEIPTADGKKYIVENENLSFEITELRRTENNIAYQVKVINKSDKEYEFYLNNLSDINLNLEDGGKIQQATSQLSSRKYIIGKNSYFIKKMYFPLDMQYHSSVIGMTFYNVRVEDSSKDIRVEF